MLVVAGGALAPGLPAFKLEPDLIFLVFLPPLRYTKSYQMSWHEFKANLRLLSPLAVGLALTTMLAEPALCVGGQRAPKAGRLPRPWGNKKPPPSRKAVLFVVRSQAQCVASICQGEVALERFPPRCTD